MFGLSPLKLKPQYGVSLWYSLTFGPEMEIRICFYNSVGTFFFCHSVSNSFFFTRTVLLWAMIKIYYSRLRRESEVISLGENGKSRFREAFTIES